MIGAAAKSYMHVIGSPWQRERNADLEWAAVSWEGALRDDPNNGCEEYYGLIGNYKVCIENLQMTMSFFPTSIFF